MALAKSYQNADVQNCGAFERHRKVCGLLACDHNHHDHEHNHHSNDDKNNGILSFERKNKNVPFRLIHFGPEKKMQHLLNNFKPELDQVGVDFFADGYTAAKYDTHDVLKA